MTWRGYPLAWPEGWPRTPPAERRDGRSHFGRANLDKGYGKRPLGFHEARDGLIAAANRLGSTSVTVSSDYPRDRKNIPKADKHPKDPGIAIYFTRDGREQVLACDRYTRAHENMRSLAMALEALATLERHGGQALLGRALEGFAALPAPTPWWETLGVAPDAPEAVITAAYRALAKAAASQDRLADLNLARDAAMKAVRER